MSNHLIYKLKIDGPYTPATIPMDRLAEYMADLAQLLGEPHSVHFSGLEEGSAIISATVEEAAMPKVRSRLRTIGQIDSPDDIRKCFDALDRKLASDNSRGSLTAYENDQPSNVVIDFPGRDRPLPIDYGVVRQEGSIDGIPVNVGGRDTTAHVILERPSGGSYSGINISREMAIEIAPHLYSAVIRLHGIGRWKRDADEGWQLVKFNADRFEVLSGERLSEIVDSLRSIPGSGWLEVEDPSSLLRELRNSEDENRH